jgi:hypothetical protein
MSGKDNRPPPDTGGGSHIENSTKGATSSRRRMLPNVGRSSDVEETDKKFDEAACSDDHKTSSSHADDSTDSNLKVCEVQLCKLKTYLHIIIKE